jgi:hypothetical protein
VAVIAIPLGFRRAPQDRADLNRRPDATASRRNAARHRLLTAAPCVALAPPLCAAKVVRVESSLRTFLLRNPHHRQIFDSAKTENRSTEILKFSKTETRISID